MSSWIRYLSSLLSPPTPSTPISPSQHTLISTKTTQILTHLQNAEWPALRAHFAPAIRPLLPATALSAGWNLILATAGPFQTVLGDPLISPGRLYTTVRVPLQFQRSKLSMDLHMTPGGSLMGLRFSPYSVADFDDESKEWQNPSYAPASSIREIETEIGGKRKVKCTLTLPDRDAGTSGARYPCVVMISGSGPCDRDCTVGPNKPFKDAAWGLAANGVAAVRFDKVTRAHAGEFDNKTVTLEDEYIEHALAAVELAKGHAEVDGDNIYVLGHSLGGWIAPRIDENAGVRGCVLLSVPARPMYRSALAQYRHLASLDEDTSEGAPLQIQIRELERQADLADQLDLSLSTPAEDLPFGLGAAYWLSCRNIDPVGTVKRLDKPVLLLQGARDYQVTVVDDYEKWAVELKGKKGVEFKVYEKLNHLFIAGEGVSTSAEYEVPSNMDEQVIRDISDWVKKCCES